MAYERLFDMLNHNENLTKDDYDYLALCAHNGEPDIRYLVADVLCGNVLPAAENILVDLLDDPDEVVRANACDALYNSRSGTVLEKLEKLAVSDRWLVRGYAVFAIGEMAQADFETENSFTFLQSAFPHERSVWVKLDYHEALYKLGAREHLSYVLDVLDRKDYRLRSKAVRVLSNVMNDANREQILFVLTQRSQSEPSQAVQQEIQTIISQYAAL